MTKMRMLGHHFQDGKAQKSFSDRVDEEMSSDLSEETTEGSEGSAASGDGVVQEVVPEPHEKSMAEMMQNPHEVLKEGIAASGDAPASGVEVAASGEVSPTGDNNPSNVVDKGMVARMGFKKV